MAHPDVVAVLSALPCCFEHVSKLVHLECPTAIHVVDAKCSLGVLLHHTDTYSHQASPELAEGDRSIPVLIKQLEDVLLACHCLFVLDEACCCCFLEGLARSVRFFSRPF